jgi:hypothetical protein
MHIDSLGLHFGHKWLMHFGCVNGFQDFATYFLDEALFQDIDTYQWSSSPKRCLGSFGHFVHMCSLSTFLFHMDIIYLFFFFASFGKFWHESYASMWENYSSKIMGIFLGLLNKTSGLITNIFWWYRPSFYGGLCPICFSRELGFGGFVFVL